MLAGGYNIFSIPETLLDYHIPFDRASRHHGTSLDCHVGFYDVDEFSILTGLYRSHGNDDGIRRRVHPDGHPHELAGPEPRTAIIEKGFQPDRTCRRSEEHTSELQSPM